MFVFVRDIPVRKQRLLPNLLYAGLLHMCILSTVEFEVIARDRYVFLHIVQQVTSHV